MFFLGGDIALRVPNQAARCSVNAPARFRSGTVWSLWDMLKLLAGNVIAAHANVARMSDQFVAMEREYGSLIAALQRRSRTVQHG